MEFIIGTIIGLIGVIPVIIPVVNWIKKPDLRKLMDKLVDKELSQQEHRKILRHIHKRLLPDGKRLKTEYIDSFILGKRGKEAVFEDLCLQNHIEPTPDFCRAMLNADAPAIRNRYYQRVKQKSIDNRQDQSSKQQVVYMSELLRDKYPHTCRQLTDILEKHGIPFRFLKATKDIWCRDYMPVQTTSGKLIQFRYEPSYLKGNDAWERLRTDGMEVCRANGLHATYSDINLDGGNVLLHSGRAIISDRVFTENPEYTDRQQLVSKLEELLEAEVIVIPSQKEDMTGHADGMVRFVNHDTLLGNNREDEYKNWTNGINKILQEHRLNFLDIPFFWHHKVAGHPNHAIGIYVNYLETERLIVLPIFEVPGNKDSEAVERFKQIFPDRTIETINYNEIGIEGGLLNCTTWTIYE